MATTSWMVISSSDDEDDLIYEYDSTWEGADCDSEENSQRNTRNRGKRNLRAAKDMQTYRHRYPEKNQPSYYHPRSDLEEEPMFNLQFYRDEISSLPDQFTITEFHTHWKGEYESLEDCHSYIQWLFPLQEAGMNFYAKELTEKEIKEFCKDAEAKQKLITSYELMLDFYGIKLIDKSTGKLERAENWRERFENLNRSEFCKDAEAKQKLITSYELMLDFYGIKLIDKSTGKLERAENWRERFENLNRHSHNNLRITRIVKSLGELGFEHYQAPLVKFFLDETLVNNNLQNVKQSVMDYFLFAVRDKEQRRKLIEYAFRHYKPKEKFVWCPKKIQQFWEKQNNGDDQEKGGQSDENGCHKKNEANLTEDSADTSEGFHCQASSVHPPQVRSSAEDPPPLNREKDQLCSPDSASLNEQSQLGGHMQGTGPEHSCSATDSPPPQESVAHEPEQEEGIKAKIESSRVPAETQSNSKDINNQTTDDTPATVQEPVVVTQNKKEIEGVHKNPNDRDFAQEIHDPPRKKDALTDNGNPVKDGGVTIKTDTHFTCSESPTALGELKESLNSTAGDNESKGARSHEHAGAAKNKNRANGVNESHSPQAEGVGSCKSKSEALKSIGPKGGVEASSSLEGAMDLHKPEYAAAASFIPEGGVNKTPRPDIGADEDQRPEVAVDDTTSGNDADKLQASDNAMICEDSVQSLREVRGDKNNEDEAEPMETEQSEPMEH